MTEPPFQYPAARLDGLRGFASGIERLVGALVRRVRARQAWIRKSDLDRSAAVLRTRRVRKSGAQPDPRLGDPLREQRAEASALAPILFFSALPWLFRFQRPQQLAQALARRGYPVLFIEGFERGRALPARRLVPIDDNLHLLRVSVPGRPDLFREILTAEAARTVAGRIADGLRRSPLMVLLQLPFWTPVGVQLRQQFGVPLVYDRIDLHSGFPGVPAIVDEVEAELLGAADLVTASADDLLERSRPLARRVRLLRNAVALADFPLAERRDHARPCCGYVGALGPWFDADAVRAAAIAHPEADFRLAGEVEDPAVAALAELPNLRLLGEIPYREVPAFLAGLDVALIPFRSTALTKAVDPVKLYEALATGLPVVAQKLPEIERWQEPAVYAYRQPEEMAGTLTQALSQDSAALAVGRRSLVLQETWDARAEALLAEVAGVARGAKD